MISLNQVEDQLKRVGCNFRFWGRAEIRELCNVLTPDETIAKCVNGHYEGGFAMLCVTDQRLLLIDRKPMFMAMEDIRFDMIAELDFSIQLLSSTIQVVTQTRTLRFTSWSQHHLRELLTYTQQRMSDLRQQYTNQQMQQAMVAAAFAAEYQHKNRPILGGLALHSGIPTPNFTMPLNPYDTQRPTILRRHTIPKFY